METSFFNSFAVAVEEMSTDGIPSVVEFVCRMLEEDMTFHLEAPREEALSIESFRLFLKNARNGYCMACIFPVPSSHLAFYRKTVERLIASRELPANAVELFNGAFQHP
jgi:hypothetical protein